MAVIAPLTTSNCTPGYCSPEHDAQDLAEIERRVGRAHGRRTPENEDADRVGGLGGENTRMWGPSQPPREEPPSEAVVGRTCAAGIRPKEESRRITIAPQSQPGLQEAEGTGLGRGPGATTAEAILAIRENVPDCDVRSWTTGQEWLRQLLRRFARRLLGNTPWAVAREATPNWRSISTASVSFFFLDLSPNPLPHFPGRTIRQSDACDK